MLGEHLFDLGGAGTALDPPDCTLSFHEHERRHHLPDGRGQPGDDAGDIPVFEFIAKVIVEDVVDLRRSDARDASSIARYSNSSSDQPGYSERSESVTANATPDRTGTSASDTAASSPETVLGR